MRYGVLAAVTAVVLASGMAHAQKPSGDAAMMPGDGFAGAWKKAGPMKTFTSADLYGYIDGGAEAFLENGFEQLTVQKYRDGANEISVELYRMTDPTAARGIYLARCGKETPDPALKERHTANRHQVLLQRHRYYLMVNNTAGGAANATILPKAAQAVAAQLPADVPVAALNLLPKPGRTTASERLIRGPVGLQAIFTLGDGDILQQNNKVTAVAADYTDAAAGAYTLIIVDYPTPAAAAAAFTYAKGHLDSYLKARTTTAAKLVFEDYEKKFGILTVTGARVEARLHLAKAPQ
ncbi:MAG: hypothetical protein NTY02_13090 [Acidobacteria bacterium]|nr:hypothetical protein [Acidobacteriota bacterium]